MEKKRCLARELCNVCADCQIVIQIKHDLIHKAKVKKSYAKLKAREAASAEHPENTDDNLRSEPPITTQDFHPERQAMLDAKMVESESPQTQNLPGPSSQKRRRKPGYFDKDQAVAERRRKEVEDKRADYARREQEKKERIEERAKFRKAMAKARTGGNNGQRKLGRESELLLAKVKRLTSHN